MNELKKLLDEMQEWSTHGPVDPDYLKIWTSRLDAYIQLQESAESVAWGQLGMLNGKTYLRENYARTSYPPPADVIRNLNLVPLYTTPPPREPITREALAKAIRAEGFGMSVDGVNCIADALRSLGIEVQGKANG